MSPDLPRSEFAKLRAHRPRPNALWRYPLHRHPGAHWLPAHAQKLAKKMRTKARADIRCACLNTRFEWLPGFPPVLLTPGRRAKNLQKDETSLRRRISGIEPEAGLEPATLSRPTIGRALGAVVDLPPHAPVSGIAGGIRPRGPSQLPRGIREAQDWHDVTPGLVTCSARVPGRVRAPTPGASSEEDGRPCAWEDHAVDGESSSAGQMRVAERRCAAGPGRALLVGLRPQAVPASSEEQLEPIESHSPLPPGKGRNVKKLRDARGRLHYTEAFQSLDKTSRYRVRALTCGHLPGRGNRRGRDGTSHDASSGNLSNPVTKHDLN
ncbi:unnamed protein product [Diplocarpon coronariae]|nr:hypothetical protein JHW43_003422 [Diplocarpon mali]